MDTNHAQRDGTPTTTRTRRAGMAALLVALGLAGSIPGCCGAPSETIGEPAPPQAGPPPTGPEVLASTVQGLEYALNPKSPKSEKDGMNRLVLARALIRLEPESELAAKEIVAKFRGRDCTLKREAERILSEVMPSSPPALIRTLLPLLDPKKKDRHADDEFLRADVAELLSAVNPKALRQEKGHHETGRARAAVDPP